MHDLVIVGAGPAGFSASVYASRYGLKNVVIGEIMGGLISESHEIGNWLGTQKISGFDFSKNAKEHAESLGAEVTAGSIESIKKVGKTFELQMSSGKVLEAKAVLLAMGTKHRHLEIPGEKEFHGKGVCYCATCDGFFFRNKTVAVIGGNNSAAGAAVYLGDIAQKVYLIYRKDKLRAEDFWVNAIKANPKIEVIFNTNLLEIRGEQKVSSVLLDSQYKGLDILALDGVFVEIGSDPNNQISKELELAMDESGYIQVDASQKTNIDGIWAAGDITTGSNNFRQIVTAASEGAIAADSIAKWLKG